MKNTQPVQMVTDERWGQRDAEDLCNGVEASKGRLARLFSLVHMNSQISSVPLPDLAGRSISLWR